MIKIYKFFLCFIIFISITFTINIGAEEDEFSYKGFTFNYDNQGSNVFPVLVVYCIYSDDIPHKYYPYYWNPAYSLYHEKLYLDLPDSDLTITGYFDINEWMFDTNKTFKFNHDEIYPVEGQYIVEVLHNINGLLFSHSINLSHDYSVKVDSAEWKYKKPDSAFSYKKSIKSDDRHTIQGIKLHLNLTNTGDIPFNVGDRYLEELPIYYKFNLKRIGTNDSIFSTDFKALTRTNDLIEGNNNEKCFFKPNETIEYNEDIVTTKGIDYDKYKIGNYIIDGEVKIDDVIYKFNSDIVLSITSSEKDENGNSGIPGFEIFTVFLVISMILYLKRKHKL